jgi:hypothetical protein
VLSAFKKVKQGKDGTPELGVHHPRAVAAFHHHLLQLQVLYTKLRNTTVEPASMPAC